MNSSYQVRHAYNLDAQANSDACQIDTGTDDQCRQEFGQECDVNVIVKRYGVQPLRAFPVGEADYDVRPSDAYLAFREAEAAFQRLPKAIRERYRDWREILAADPQDIEAILHPLTAPPDKQGAKAPPSAAADVPADEPKVK